jgi:hypothetical protein
MKPLRAFLEDIWASKTSILGAILVTVSSILIIIAVVQDNLGLVSSPYHGILAYLIFPGIFVLGLVMIPLGIYYARRKARRLGQPVQSLVIDLNRPEHRRRIAFVLAMTFINSVILSVVSYEGYQYTDSTEFCGKVCHTVMQPEFVAYQRSPHARVGCVECHIGGGASWYVKSKLSGLRQVWAVMTHSFSRPIPTPVQDLRPARDTCEECHWPQMFHGQKVAVRRSLEGGATPDDPLVTVLLLNIGGYSAKSRRYEGIHWHVSGDARVEYLAADAKRTQIPRVRTIRSDGTRVEYAVAGAPPAPPNAEWRTLDCIDCHNRPTHIFENPQRAVDAALIDGRMDASLPGIREAALKAVTADYPSTEAARAGIEKSLRDTYRVADAGGGSAPAAAVRKAAEAAFQIYRVNVFPEMKVSFGLHKSHLGHQEEGYGCFRCHDDSHTAADGKTIFQDCDQCHELLAQEEREKSLPPEIRQRYTH